MTKSYVPIMIGVIVAASLIGGLVYVVYIAKPQQHKPAAAPLTNTAGPKAADHQTDKRDGAIPLDTPSLDGTDDAVTKAHKKSGAFVQQGDTISARGLRISSGSSFELPAFLCGTGPAAPKCVQLSHCPGDF